MKNPGPSAIPKGREKAVLEPKSGVGEGCSGRGGPAGSCRRDACTPKKCQGSGGVGELEG